METESTFDGTEAPDYALYRPGDVAMATLLGSPIAGAIVIGLNSARLGRPRERRFVLGLSGLGLAILTGVLWNFPAGVSAGGALLSIAVMYKLEQALHGRALAEHKRRGGAHPSTWKAPGIGLLCLLAFLLIGVALAVVEDMRWESHEFYANDTVHFAGDSTEQDVRTLAWVLKEFEWFGGEGQEAHLERSEGTNTVSLYITGDYRDPDVEEWTRALARALAAEGLGRPIEIHLCDWFLEAQNTIRVE